MAERNPVYSGSILPFSTTAEGETYFDPDAGILGPLRDALMLPSRVARGEFGSEIGARNPELMEEAANFAATFTGTGLAIPKPRNALGMSGGDIPRSSVPTRKDIAEIGTQMGEAKKAGNEELFQSLKAQQAEMKARFDEANPKQPKAKAAPVPINKAARGRIGEKGFENDAEEFDAVADVFPTIKTVAARRASYADERGIPFVSKVRQQIETIDDDARMTGAQLLKNFRRNGVRDEALESSGIMYLLEKNKNNPVLTKDELVKAHERFAPKIELEDVPLNIHGLYGLDPMHSDMQRLFDDRRGIGSETDYFNYEEVVFRNTNKEMGKYDTEGSHHDVSGNIGHARLSTTDVGKYKNVSVVEEMQSDLQSLEMNNLLVGRGISGFNKKLNTYFNEKKKQYAGYLQDLDDADEIIARSEKQSPNRLAPLSEEIQNQRARINQALDDLEKVKTSTEKLKNTYSGKDTDYMEAVAEAIKDTHSRKINTVGDFVNYHLGQKIYQIGNEEAINFAAKGFSQRNPTGALAESDALKALQQLHEIRRSDKATFISPSVIQKMEDPNADLTPEARSLILTEGIMTSYGSQRIPVAQNEALAILEGLNKASPEARAEYLKRIEGDANLKFSLSSPLAKLQPALPFKDTFDMSKYQADLLIERAFNKGQNGIAFPDYRDIAAQRGVDEKSFVRGYKDAPDAALKEALERYPGAKIVEENLSGTKHPAKILVFGEAKRVEDKPLFVNYAKGGMVYKGIGSMGREVL